MASIVDMVREVITPDVIRGASNVIGENAVATQSAFKVVVPTILAGAVSHAATPSGAERLFTTITNGRYGADMLNGLGGKLEGSGAADSLLRSGEGLVSTLFGSQSDMVTDAVAQSGGMQKSSASRLLSLAAPIVMSVLGKVIATRGLDARGLTQMLSAERHSIVNALPPGLARTLGLEETVAAGASQAHEREPAHAGSEPKREHRPHQHRKRSFRPALIGGLAALALLFFLTRGRNREEVQLEVPPAAERIQEMPPAPVPQPQPEMPAMSQPSGTLGELDSYLSNQTGGETPRNFVLQGVTFESGSSKMSPETETVLIAVADVMKAHPTAVIRIEGHTDSQGDAAASRKLSLERAQALKKALVRHGVTAEHVQTKGVGPDQPLASNDSEDGRAQNRRTEVVVIKR